MRHFVPDRVFHELREMFRTACRAFVRTLENGDPVRHGKRIKNAADCQWPPLVESEKRRAAGDAGARQLGSARFGFAHQRDVLHAGAKLIGNEVPGD